MSQKMFQINVEALIDILSYEECVVYCLDVGSLATLIYVRQLNIPDAGCIGLLYRCPNFH